MLSGDIRTRQDEVIVATAADMKRGLRNRHDVALPLRVGELETCWVHRFH